MGRRRRRRGRPLTGLVLVDKPSGPTSFDTVERVRRALNANRAGHTGTLDPLATGLLPVCLGTSTRLARFISDADKAYRGTLLLGVATDTLDAQGEITAEDPPEAVAAVTAKALASAIAAFDGPITQRPPAYSAIKVDGERLYARARRGEAVEAPERQVVIHQLELVEFDPPRVVFDVRCSKGTYVRTLAADIAAKLGLSAHLIALRRTAVGALDVAEALPLTTIEAEPERAEAARLTPAASVAHLPTVHASPALVRHLQQGRRRPVPDAPLGLCRVLAPDGALVAIIEARGAEPADIVRGMPQPSPPSTSSRLDAVPPKG